MRRLSQIALAALVLVLVSTVAWSQTGWGSILKGSQRIELGLDGGIGFGEVDTGYAAFVFDVEREGPLTIEVVVTEIREGAEYEDADSILFLFDSDGYRVAENDDGPYGYQSLINGAWIEYPGRYYAIITTHPNFPEVDGSGFFAGISEDGLRSFAFELIVEYGERDGDDYDSSDYGEYGFGDVDVTIPWDEFLARAERIRYNPEGTVVEGEVGAEVAVYAIDIPDPTNLTAEVVITRTDNDQYGDSVLFLFDSDGFLIAEDDDGGFEGASRLSWVPIERSGRYYLAVTAYPSWPATDENGFLDGFGFSDGAPFEFELIISESAHDVGANSFGEILETAQFIPTSGGRGIAAGEVREGFSSFVFGLESSAYVTIEVVVTKVLPGAEYEDSDSVLFIFDAGGRLVAEDDDGGFDSASKIEEAELNPGEYFVVVVTYPAYPDLDFEDRLVGLEPNGGSHIEFDLVLRIDEGADDSR